MHGGQVPPYPARRDLHAYDLPPSRRGARSQSVAGRLLDKNGAAAPALAKSWKQTNDTTWTFELRKATFQDGTEVTAESVVNALNHAGAAEPMPRVLSDVPLTAKAEDADTVTISTKTADLVLPLRLASPALGILAPKAYGKDGTVTPVGTGTGPFEITKLTGKSKATLDRYDGYWGGKAKSSGIDVTWIADGTARANALHSGDADIAEWIPTAQAKLLDKDTRHEVPSVRTDSLILNTRSGIFTDTALRASVREAVDGSALVDSVFGGYADRAQGLFGPAVPCVADTRVTVTGRARAATKGKTLRLATYTNRAPCCFVPGVAAATAGRQSQLWPQVVAKRSDRRSRRVACRLCPAASDGTHCVWVPGVTAPTRSDLS